MIYFALALDGPFVKIGYSCNPTKRVKDLQTACPHKLKLAGVKPGTQADEKIIHDMFSKDRLHGEWFKASGDVLDYIQYCTYKKPGI